MHKNIKPCESCGRYVNTGAEGEAIDGTEYGFEWVCSACMRMFESRAIAYPRPWLDLIKWTLPIRVSHGIELLETESKPHWYFIRTGSDIVYQGEDFRASIGRFDHHVNMAIAEQQKQYLRNRDNDV